MKQVLDFTKIIVLLVIAVFFIGLTHTLNRLEREFAPDLKSSISHINKSAENLEKITTSTQEYLGIQLKMLKSPSSQAALKASIEVAATAKGSLLVLNKVILPEVRDTVKSANEAVQSLNELVMNSNSRINQELLPEATATLSEVRTSVKTVQEETVRIGNDISLILANPAITDSLDSIAASTEHLRNSSKYIEEAIAEAPGIAKDVHTVTSNTSKVSKAVSIGRIVLIVATVAGLFL